MEDSLDQIIRRKKFENNKEQIRNFITHCLGFQPEDLTGGEFANDFTWKTKNSELNITFYQGCTWKDEKDYFWYILRINGNKIEGEYHFNDHIYCEDEEEIVGIIQPFKDCIENRKTLNVTSTIEHIPFIKRFYVIQAFQDNYWRDVIVSRGDICTANKKARHYRNQNNCETRVIEIREEVSYSYEYEQIDSYKKNEASNRQEAKQ